MMSEERIQAIVALIVRETQAWASWCDSELSPDGCLEVDGYVPVRRIAELIVKQLTNQ